MPFIPNIVASVTDNVDKNLGLKTFLNGALVSNIIIDTSLSATDTIDYVATDQSGNTATTGYGAVGPRTRATLARCN